MGDVIHWPGITTLPIDPANVLDGATAEEFESVFIMGYLKNGDIYFAASDADGGEVLWLMEVAKIRLMKIAGEPD